jgi:hypothetical protein
VPRSCSWFRLMMEGHLLFAAGSSFCHCGQAFARMKLLHGVLIN